MLIGLLLQGAAGQSFRQLQLRQALSSRRVQDFMDVRPSTVPPWISLSVLAKDFFAKQRMTSLPVVEDEKLLGIISTSDLRHIPRAQWDTDTVRATMHPVNEENSIAPSASATDA